VEAEVAGAGVAVAGGVDQRMTVCRRGVAFLQLHPAQEDTMSEMEMKTDVEVEDFTDELSDEALDRATGEEFTCTVENGNCSGPAPRYAVA
jgi:hypothetical protein